jgi:hypothetical protein
VGREATRLENEVDLHKQLYRSSAISSSNISNSSSRSCGSSCTSGSDRLPDFEAVKVGDCGPSDAWKEESMEDAELGYLRCPCREKVGVTGEGPSEVVDVCENEDEERSISASTILSRFLFSSATFCGKIKGLSLRDMMESSRGRVFVYPLSLSLRWAVSLLFTHRLIWSNWRDHLELCVCVCICELE